MNPADKIIHKDISDLIPSARNSRIHEPEQVDQIAASMREFGWTMPVLIDEAGEIIAGHGRVMAAKKLKIETVPCLVAEGWSDSQKRAYRIADNRLTENSRWDSEMLSVEMGDLQEAGYDLEITGFSSDEIESLIDGAYDFGYRETKAVSEGEAVADGMPSLPSGERAPFQQKTFTLHDEQVDIIDDALQLARSEPLCDTGLNENSNGNALALICEQWLEGKNG